MIDAAGWVLIVAVLILAVATGGLISSLLNRRIARRNQKMIEELGQKVDHTNKNAKMVKTALDARYAKEAAALASGPVEVTIVNNATDPVPVEDVNGDKGREDGSR